MSLEEKGAAMSKKNWSNVLSVLARTALAFVFVFGQTAWAMQGQNGKDQPGASTAGKSQHAALNPAMAAGARAQRAAEDTTRAENPPVQENTHRGGQHEGIKVHGHWTIEVLNPDGTLVTHREFENSLADAPFSLLPPILSRTLTVGFWAVLLDGTGGGPCASAGCQVSEGGAPNFSGYVPYNNLQVSTAGVPPNGNVLRAQLVLSGTATALASSAVNQVQTILTYCPNTIAPGAIAANVSSCQLGFAFTSAALAAPVQVSSGQSIAVTVNISFS
jgi:hypothetical protein